MLKNHFILQYDHEAEEQAILDHKLSRLEALEARWRADTERNPSYYATSYSSWLNYGTSLVTNIIENLQLNVKDVHFRYEDTNVLPGKNINKKFANSFKNMLMHNNWVFEFFNIIF